MLTLLAAVFALSIDQPHLGSWPGPQLRSSDAGLIVQTVLEAVIPEERRNGPPFRDALRGRTLILDTVRTMEAFRQVDPQASPDYRDVTRAFVARRREDAVPCDRTTMPRCWVVDDGVYAAITKVERDVRTSSYRLILLVLRSGPRIVQGYEQELFVVKTGGTWRVEKFGVTRVIN